MIKKLALMTAALAMMTGMIASAFAAEVTAMVTSIDPASRVIVLDSGKAFMAAEDVDLEAVTEGKKVLVVYNDGTTDATDVTIIE